jgi:hypothetical protein
MDVRTRVLVFRTGRMLRQENRRRRQQLARELATYSTQADIDDLCGTLDSYPDGQTQEIRQILWQQQVRRTWTAGGAR